MKGEKKPLQAKFYGTDKKMDIHSKEEMDKLLASLKDKEYEINEVKKGERIKNAPLPFTTDVYKRQVHCLGFFYCDNAIFGNFFHSICY